MGAAVKIPKLGGESSHPLSLSLSLRVISTSIGPMEGKWGGDAGGGGGIKIGPLGHHTHTHTEAVPSAYLSQLDIW